ncbi:11031_t:CDS:10 [Entrophospora sp. SA101]|nr:11031_t:CDS:10 [Entrophospora sp. SA101]
MDILGTCCTLLGCISAVVNEVHNHCKNAKDNREKYERISQRIETNTSQLMTFCTRSLKGDKNFNPNNMNFVDNLQRYLNAVTEIRNLVKKYDKLKKKNFLQIAKANKYSDKIKNLEKRYERALGDIVFTINMENYKSNENLGNQVQDLNDTVRKEFELFLKTVEDVFKKNLTENSKNLGPQSKIIAKETHKVNKGEFKISLSYDEFQEKDLTDPKPDNISVRGKVFKKMLKETIQVACVPFDAQLYCKDEKDELEATLAILSKLHSSDSIIKFHGTSRVNDKDVLIFDWAHKGNLKYVYEEYNKQNKLIPWKKKLKIAYGIATAKIANFSLSRNFGDISRQFKSGEKKYEMERWTAPEKLKKTSYSVECEVFRLVRMIFAHFPYIKKFENDYEEISQHILNKKREDLNFDYKHSSDIQQCFKEIISTAWKHEPGERLKLPDILTKLEILYNKYYVFCEESSTEAISKNSIPLKQVVNEVHNICKNAKDNREKYERISQRIETTTCQLRTLYVRLLNGDKNLNPNNVHFVDNLQRYLNSVTEIRNTVKKYDKLKKKSFWQLVNANKYSDKIKNLEKRYERALGDLDFTINMENYKSIENLGNQVQDLHDTVRKKSELLLKTVEDGFKKLTENSKNLGPQSKMIAKEAHKVNKGEFKISLSYDEFQEKDLTDPKPDNISVRGKVFKKMLKETIQVACVPFNAQLYYKDEKDELEATLAILSKLHSSDSIIKFHGTSRVNDKDVLIFDWAHKGNLKYVYEEYNKQNKLIPWKKKLKIAYDICLGLQFLHKCEFYHRIATAKIANFFLSRNFGDISRQFKSGEKKYEMERWTAPEKLKKTSYSVECEVFSFGMLLWELSFQQVPYIKKFENNYEEISQHILNKKREDLNFDYKHSSDIQQCFKEIISTAWKHEPGERLKLPDILTKLETLYNKYYVSCEESSTEAISKNSIPLEQEAAKNGIADAKKILEKINRPAKSFLISVKNAKDNREKYEGISQRIETTTSQLRTKITSQIENLGNQVQDLNDTVRKDELEATLAILNKLHSSDSIIKFHGTSCVGSESVLIFDWAHMGNLKYVYGEYNKQIN